jgi:YrbI family 3-deoxy-D-manno-octulosonate 8-phosphate phosphatase
VKSLAIIPARGGSKGVPRKNLLPLAGVPLVTHTVRAALESGVFDTVAVSTEDAEIAEIARAAGGEVVLRPPDMASDTALTEPVMAHALGVLEELRGARYDSVWLLQPTSPLRTSADIRRAAALLERIGTDSVVSMTPDHAFYWRSHPGTDLVVPEYDLRARPRRQELPPRWRENGAIYGVMRDVWEREGVRAAGRVLAYEMPAERSLEIDTEADWRLAEATLDVLTVSVDRKDLMASVKAVAFDFDGVLTDNMVRVAQDGTESVSCSRSDGWGIARLQALGYPIVVISTESNPVVSARCRKLSVECVQGVSDKPAALKDWLGELGIDPAACAFVGNDENDVACLEMAGLAVVPADAHAAARRVADVVLRARGGRGAARELCDLIAEAPQVSGTAGNDEGGLS